MVYLNIGVAIKLSYKWELTMKMNDKDVLKMLKALKYSRSIIENHVANMKKRKENK